MPCHYFAIKDPKTGEVMRGHINAGRSRPRICVECQKPQATLLCDGPPSTPNLLDTPAGAEAPSCSRPICVRCATRLSDGRDFCKRPACQAAAHAGALEIRARGMRAFAR